MSNNEEKWRRNEQRIDIRIDTGKFEKHTTIFIKPKNKLKYLNNKITCLNKTKYWC